MFKSVPATSFDAISPDGDESDDNISLTSTVSGHDPDQEFGVEDILAEDQFDGKTYYLVQWTGFQLHESTWELESNLGDELKAMWEEDKAKHATGELELFNIQKFNDALDQAKKEKEGRHRRRNVKRKKLGLPLTAPTLVDESSDEDEASEEEPGIELSVSETMPTALPQNQQRISKGGSTSRPEVTPITTSAARSNQLRNEARPHNIGPKQQTEAPSATSKEQRQTAPLQTTGYQGTARRPGRTSTTTDAVPKSKPRLSILTPGAPPTNSNLGARKNLTAKKSTTQPTGNIFTSGKMRKQRSSLKDVMSDTSKQPKLFSKVRFRRLAQLKSRDKEDAAPDISKVNLFELRTGRPLGGSNSTASVLSPTQLSPPVGTGLEAAGPRQASALISSRATVDNSGAQPPRKKRKSVRFFGDDDSSALVHEPEQMDIDVPIRQRASLRSPPPPQRLSLNETGEVPPVQESQSTGKQLILGQSSVGVIFNGLPRESASRRAWLADFLAKKSLEFTHTCFAKTLEIKLSSLVQEPLASGTIISQDNESALEQVERYLADGLLGLYCGEAEYNVLVFPTKCEEWKSISLGQDPASPSGATLRYIIFASVDGCKPTSMLPPLAPLSEAKPSAGDPKPETQSRDDCYARELIIKRLFGFDYKNLLPAVSRPPAVDNFFLAIPNSRREVLLALYHWLRASNPTCQIFTSHHAGGWDAFRAWVDHNPGVVIIHETLAWSMRRFPNLSKYLITRNDEYWCFSEPVHGLPLYPSISAPELPPGDMRLTRLFPYRTAILLTPSFLVSEPLRSLEFLKWFFKNRAGNFGFRLITAYNIHDYLFELAEERNHARQDLWDSPGDMLPEMEANLGGLSKEECDSRYAAAEIAADLHLTRTLQAGPFAHDEDSSSLVYADSSIDPNDEQSLVNWFGWWSTLRADQFRKFHVIGSSQSIKMHGCRRGELRARIPKYSKVTLNDPDAVLEVLQEMNEQVEASEADASENRLQASANAPHEVSMVEQGRWSFRSNLISQEDPNCFAKEHMDGLTVLDGFRLQWMMFKYPISWLDLQMAEYFGDFTAKWARFHDWFNFTFPFGACYKGDKNARVRPAHGYNTYVGFFYTIDKEWDPDNPPAARPLMRYPWLGIYRPVNPHMKPYRRCELIIWDPAARTRYPRGPPAEKDLIFMQRQLIQFIRENSGAKNNGTWLDQVWYGGWDWPADCDAQSPIDVTLLFLRRLLGDLRHFVPAPERLMETKGYRRVILSLDSEDNNGNAALSPSPSSSHANSALFVDSGDPMDIDDATTTTPPLDPAKDEDEEEEDEDTRIIFHPPRGTTKPHGRGGVAARSRCVNRLYEEARLARNRSGWDTEYMRYQFVPTVEWYREQKNEGRGYAHVNVDSWEGVFKLLRVGEGPAVAQQQAGEGKRGSVGSA